MKKIFLTMTLLLGLMATPAFATETTFTDVPESHWAYSTISAAVDAGLFKGTSETTFDPDSSITRAEFITVIMRAVASDVDISATTEDWWSGSYYAAIDIGILEEYNPSSGANYYYHQMTDDMSRQEMATALANAMTYTGETLKDDISSSRIPDFADLTTSHRAGVLLAYSNGLLAGVDDKGNFAPRDTLTRAQACTVLMRLIDANQRISIKSDVEYYEIYDVSGITGKIIYEGRTRDGINAQEGDTVIKADGTMVTLAYGEVYGILGEGQGVAADLGLQDHNGTALMNGMSYYTSPSLTDSFGTNINNHSYKLNPITGCAHWGSEIQHIEYPDYDGTFVGQLSNDLNWIWTELRWMLCFNIDPDYADVDAILEANGL